MGVFPSASQKLLPQPYRHLMDDEDSPIIDFYPTDFKIDKNGKKVFFSFSQIQILKYQHKLIQNSNTNNFHKLQTIV